MMRKYFAVGYVAKVEEMEAAPSAELVPDTPRSLSYWDTLSIRKGGCPESAQSLYRLRNVIMRTCGDAVPTAT